MKTHVYKKSRARADAREPERHKLHITKGDTVRVISGEHRGKEGKVLRVFPKEFRVEVEGVNIVKKHKRAANPNQESGIIELTAPIAASKVMLLDPKSGEPTRIRPRVDKDGTVERIAVKSGQPIPRAKAKWPMADTKEKEPKQGAVDPGAAPQGEPAAQEAPRPKEKKGKKPAEGEKQKKAPAPPVEEGPPPEPAPPPRLHEHYAQRVRAKLAQQFGLANYSIGIKEQMIFPEIDYDKVDKIHGMDITLVTSAGRDDTALALLREMGMPFRGESPVAVN